MFGIGPAYLFVLRQRLPFGLMHAGWQPWRSTMETNLAIALLASTLIWLIGIKAFLLVHVPIMLVAASVGVWLFYVQHQFERTTWENDREWNPHRSALHGSSHYDLPALLRWFTANVGVHHVHHLCSRITNFAIMPGELGYPRLRIQLNRAELVMLRTSLALVIVAFRTNAPETEHVRATCTSCSLARHPLLIARASKIWRANATASFARS